jgi:hypothetical protein
MNPVFREPCPEGHTNRHQPPGMLFGDVASDLDMVSSDVSPRQFAEFRHADSTEDGDRVSNRFSGPFDFRGSQ